MHAKRPETVSDCGSSETNRELSKPGAVQREAFLPRMPVGLEGTVESMTFVVDGGLWLPRGPRGLRQLALKFAGLDIDDADGIHVAIGQSFAIGRKG